MTRLLLTLALLGTPVCGVLWAQDAEPGPGVARISLINGDVSVRRADSGDFVAAAINAPLVAPDTILTGRSSRAEVQLDYANMVRLAPSTEVRLTELEYERFQVQVAIGLVNWSVLRDSNADVDISTPNVSVRPVRRGRYRVEVRADGTTVVTVRDGEAEIFTPAGSEFLREGRMMIVRGPADSPEFQIASAARKDEWDEWNRDRDKYLERSASYRYASRDIVGVDDLDYYGTWVNVDSYGWCWRPRVVAGWAPYRYGRWSWIDYYGWSWVSYDPWGWAPYHYGRWFHHGPYGWVWYPGHVHVRHYWSPALVAFVGWGGHSGLHLGVGFGFGRIGWVPLAPYEPYHPWYGRDYYHGYRNGTYIDNSVTVVNNVNITNVYRNARVPEGVTAVNAGEFGRGQVRNVYRHADHELSQASLVRGQAPVVPQRDSLRLSERTVDRASLTTSPRSAVEFYSRRPVNQPERVPFSDQQRGMQQVVSRTAQQTATRTAASPRATQGSTRAATDSPRAGNPSATRTAGEAPSNSGWGRVGEASTPQRTVRETGATRGTGQTADRPGAVSPRSATDSITGRTARTPEATRGSTPAPPADSPSRSGGWRRFGEPTRSGPEANRGAAAPTGGAGGRTASPRSSSAASGATGTDRSSGGWESFGQPTRSSTRGATGSQPGSRTAQPEASPSRTPSRTAQPSAAPVPSRTPSRSAQPSSREQSSSEGWSRFGTGSTGSSRTATPRSSGSSSRMGTSSGSSAPRADTPSSSRGSVGVSPPMVHQRSTPSYEDRSSRGSSSPSSSAPRYEPRSAPSRSTPSFERSAPSRSAPSYQRSAPRSEPRSAPSYERSAPSRSAPSYERSAPSRSLGSIGRSSAPSGSPSRSSSPSLSRPSGGGSAPSGSSSRESGSSGRGRR